MLEFYTVGSGKKIKKYNTLSEIARDIKEGRLRKNCRVHKTILLPKRITR